MKYLQLSCVLFVFVIAKIAEAQQDTTDLRDSESNSDDEHVENRIIGGEDANDADFPFLVKLKRISCRVYPNWGQWCDDESLTGVGTLIHDDLVLTTSSSVFAISNSVNRYYAEFHDGNRLDVTQTVTHPDYFQDFDPNDTDIRYYYNDLMILKLQNPVDTSLYPPIELIGESKSSQMHTAIGYRRVFNNPFNRPPTSSPNFGSIISNRPPSWNLSTGKKTSEKATNIEEKAQINPQAQLNPLWYTETFKKNRVPIIADRICQSNYEKFLDPSVHICAGYQNGSNETCHSYHGEPLIKETGYYYRLVGLNSWKDSDECGSPYKNTVYTRVSAAHDWIREQICELSSNPPFTCH